MLLRGVYDGDEKKVQQSIQKGCELSGKIIDGYYYDDDGGIGYDIGGYDGYYYIDDGGLTDFVDADLLWIASSRGHVSIVSLLLRQGLLNTPSKDNKRPSDIARAQGHQEVVRLLEPQSAEVSR